MFSPIPTPSDRLTAHLGPGPEVLPWWPIGYSTRREAYNGTRVRSTTSGRTLESQTSGMAATTCSGRNYFQVSRCRPRCRDAVPLGRLVHRTGGIFNGSVSAFVEDAGFVKLREISSVNLRPGVGQPDTSVFGSIDLRVAGRNLVTWTNTPAFYPRFVCLARPARSGGLITQQSPVALTSFSRHSQPLMTQRDFRRLSAMKHTIKSLLSLRCN